MTLAIKFTRLVSLFPNKNFLQWELTDPPESGPYTFNLYTSGAQEGPWETLIEGNYNNYWYLDESVGTNKNLYSLSREIFYKVVAVAPNGTSAEYIQHIEPNINRKFANIRRKLRRDLSIALKPGLFGSDIAILKKKRWGTLCTTCLDATGQPLLSDCSVCYGTKFVNGYWDPVYAYGQIEEAPIEVQTTFSGKTEQHVQLITTLDLPLVEKGDYIIFLASNTRYEVLKNNPTNLKLTDVHQRILASEIARSDNIYTIDVDQNTSPPLY